jgi:ATP-dependent DNA helicase RecG
LVATTVVEVGVDVKAATVMVIEHAERFGLAQLHQLRGRIGRNNKDSFVLLMYAENGLTQTARERLKTIRETQDGFVIAEKDLELRGAGEVLGTKQSGVMEFRIADLTIHKNLLETAHKDAILCIDKDASFSKTPRGGALRSLLYLFRHDSGIKSLRGG